MLLKDCNQDPDSLFTIYESQKMYLFFDTVHLIKSVRNNLLNYKRFLFPSFNFNDFKDPINLQGGEISWKTFHDVSEKDALLEAHLKKAPTLNCKVLHPGNCKQNVPVALAIFNETTSAAIEQYFPERKESADFLRLFNTWWIISNSKNRFSNHILGHAARKSDKKPEFLREMANWLEYWHSGRIPNFQRFTLTTQTAAALIRTL